MHELSQKSEAVQQTEMQMPFENIATTSDQQSSQTTNKTIVSINRVKVLSINNTLQCQSQQLSMLYSCKENLEPNLNVFSVKFFYFSK